jgi:hypothetical protein
MLENTSSLEAPSAIALICFPARATADQRSLQLWKSST